MGLFKRLGESAQKAAAKAAEQAKVAGEKLKPVTEQLAAKGSEALEQASQTQIGQKVTRTASSVTTKVQHNVTAIAESDFGKSVGQKASQLGDSMSDAARWSTEQISQASVSVSSAIDAAQMRKDPQAQQKEDERIHSAEVAKESLQETTAQIVLQALGPSPVDLNYKICDKAKTLFPIPCEQQILWMDAEFDLRPSGIIATDQGVFVKTDESIMPSGEDAEKSKLIYVKWDSFDPTWFIADSDENMAWKVNPECRTTFIETCRSLAPEEEPVETRLLEAEEQYGDMGLDATVRPATLRHLLARVVSTKCFVIIIGIHVVGLLPELRLRCRRSQNLGSHFCACFDQLPGQPLGERTDIEFCRAVGNSRGDNGIAAAGGQVDKLCSRSILIVSDEQRGQDG